MIYSRRALLALFAVLALSSAASDVLAQPPDAPAAPVSPLQARRAEREAEKEAAAAAAAAPAPAPAKAKKAKNATASGADALLPATGKTNTKYFVSARSALYTPAPKGSDKPGTLKLEGLIQTILGEVHSNDRADSNIGRVTAAQLFNGAKVKERLPVFDKKEGGMDVLLLGKRGPFFFESEPRRGGGLNNNNKKLFFLSVFTPSRHRHHQKHHHHQNKTKQNRRPRQERLLPLPRHLPPPRLQGRQGLVRRV